VPPVTLIASEPPGTIPTRARSSRIGRGTSVGGGGGGGGGGGVAAALACGDGLASSTPGDVGAGVGGDPEADALGVGIDCAAARPGLAITAANANAAMIAAPTRARLQQRVDIRLRRMIANGARSRAQMFEMGERFGDGELLVSGLEFVEMAIASRPGQGSRDCRRVRRAVCECGDHVRLALGFVCEQFVGPSREVLEWFAMCGQRTRSCQHRNLFQTLDVGTQGIVAAIAPHADVRRDRIEDMIAHEQLAAPPIQEAEMTRRVARRPNGVQTTDAIAVFELARRRCEFGPPIMHVFIERIVEHEPVARDPIIGRTIHQHVIAQQELGEMPVETMHEQLRQARALQRTGETVMIEMCVRDRNARDIAERDAAEPERFVKSREHVICFPAAIDERVAIVVFEQVAVDVTQRIVGHRQTNLNDAVAEVRDESDVVWHAGPFG